MDLGPALKRGSGGPSRPIARMLEIAGLPGAGKSSLLAVLAQRRPELKAVDHWRRLSHLPILTTCAFGLFPLFLAQRRAGQPLARRDMERMVRLCASRRIAEGWRRGEEVVMDQGPIYTLARLRLSGCDRARSERLGIWWTRIAREWASVLDTVIYLEANDDVLLHRITGRKKTHPLKSCTHMNGLAWLATLREALEGTVQEFRASSNLSVLCFDTGEESLARVADRVIAAME